MIRSINLNSFSMKLIVAFPVAIFLDIIDYIPLTYITPGLLQIADILSVVILFPFIGPISFIGLIDILPLIGLLPTYTILVIIRLFMYLGSKK